MNFLRIENNRILYYDDLSECKNCHKQMIKWFMTIPEHAIPDVHRHGVVKESYSDSTICSDCVNLGGFLKKCDCCEVEREFPIEFKYLVKYYHKNPDEIKYEYICLTCLMDNQNNVIEMLAGSDKISEI